MKTVRKLTLLAAVILLFVSAVPVLAAEESGAKLSDLISEIKVKPSEVAAGTPVKCTVYFKETVQYDRIDLMCEMIGYPQAYDSMGKTNIHKNVVEFKLDTSKLSSGKYAIKSVTANDTDIYYPSEEYSFNVRGLEYVEGSITLSPEEVKAGGNVTVTAKYTDVPDAEGHSIKSAKLFLVKGEGSKEEEFSAFKTRQDGNVTTVIWTYPAGQLPENTVVTLKRIEVMNGAGQVEKVLTAIRFKVVGDSPSEGQDENGGDSGKDSGSGGGTGSDGNDSSGTSSGETDQPADSSDSGNGDSSRKEQTTPEQSQTAPVSSRTPTETGTAAVPFSAKNAGAPGMSAAKTVSYFTKKVKSDDPFLGTAFGLLQARQAKVTNNSVTLKWKKPSGAKNFIILGSLCGKTFKKLGETAKTSFTARKLKKGKYYKFIVIAADGSGNVVSTSTSVICATSGGSWGNIKSVKVSGNKTISLTAGQSKKLSVRMTKTGKKVKTYRYVYYEWDNQKVIDINRGVITALKKGTASVYVFAQNGIYKKLTVKVS